jgi:hypothetical protein
MEVIKFLSNFSNGIEYDIPEALEALEQELGIKSKVYENFFVLNYSQIDSPKTHPIVKECRGLILDNYLRVLRRPFDRFFNYGEADTQNFDFKKSVCIEKVDGSLVPAWWNPYQKKWCFGTRGTAFAECECNSGRVFEKIINDCFLRNSKEFIANTTFYRGSTYIFELCSPENRVVVPHTDTYLVLLGIRSNNIGFYYDFEFMYEVINELKSQGVNVRLPKTYDISSLDEIQTSFKTERDEVFFEGYVFWNSETDERVKCKNPTYVQIHHLRDNGNLNPKRICELVFANETEEYLSYFAEDKKYFDPWINAYDVMIESILFTYEVLSKRELTQKEYALLVKDYPYSGIMFALRQGKTLEQCFEKMNSEAKVRLLEYFKE